jgi:hypothetical protein
MGGPHALTTAQQSVAGMRTLINDFCMANSGQFLDYAGKKIAW